MSTGMGYPRVSLFYDSGNVLLDEWLTMLSADDFTYLCYSNDENTQEWSRCEGDSSILIVNSFTIHDQTHSRDGLVKIYFDEELVGQFHHDLGHIFPNIIFLKETSSFDDVHSAILEFIKKWGIGV